jgi:predicted nucleotidyltransferase
MLNLYKIATQIESEQNSLSPGEELSVYYHNLFDYPLNFQDLIKWKANETQIARFEGSVIRKSGYFYQEGREGLIYKRLLRKRVSAKKMTIARRAAKTLSLIPTVRMVAVTGSLAMQNSSPESDIDLLVITGKGSLWTTRLISYLMLKLVGASVRKPHDKNEKDKLCLNMWLDESDTLCNKNDRNLYTAHEIAQIVPLINKQGTYEKLLQNNKWILDFWPNSVRIAKNKKSFNRVERKDSTFQVLEKFLFKIQRRHMKPKITREVVTSTRALFHPQNWGKVVMGRLSS